MIQKWKSLFNKKPILLLDVDGVIAPLGVVDNGKYVSINGWSNICVPLDVIDWLKEMTNIYEIVWCSTWSEHAVSIGEQIGLDNFDYIDFTGCNPDKDWVKEANINQYLKKNKNRKILLIDDETPLDVDFCRHVEVIRPNSILGINEKEKTYVENYGKRETK